MQRPQKKRLTVSTADAVLLYIGCCIAMLFRSSGSVSVLLAELFVLKFLFQSMIERIALNDRLSNQIKFSIFTHCLYDLSIYSVLLLCC